MFERPISDICSAEMLSGREIDLGSVAFITAGCQYPQYDWPREDLQPYTVIEKITTDSFTLEGPKYIRVTEREKANFLLRTDDIVIKNRTSASEFGKCAVFNLFEEVLHTKYLRIRPEKGYDSAFLNRALNLIRSQGKLHQLASHSKSISTLSIEDLKRLKVPCFW